MDKRTDRELLELLVSKVSSLETRMSTMETKIGTIETDVKDLRTDAKGLKEGQNRIENKLDDIETQNADSHLTIGGEIRKIKASLSKIEIVTADNWGDIARLKAVRKPKTR